MTAATATLRMTIPTTVDMVDICYIKTKKDYMWDEEEMEALTTSTSEYGEAFPTFSSLPFTNQLANELANESNLGVTGKLLSLLTFVHLR
jgi:hypothetical protein